MPGLHDIIAQRPLVRPVVAAVVAIALLTPVGSASAAVAGFSDVDDSATHAVAVAWLVDQAITEGTAPGSFSPNGVVTRGQMATFLHRFAGEPQGPAPDFGDVAAGAFYLEAVGWLASTGITTGTGPGTFSPDAPVTRAQMALFLHRFAGTPPAGDPGTNRTPGSFDPPVVPDPATNPSAGTAFLEAGGLVVIETTSLDVPAGWRQFPSEADGDQIEPGATNGSYIQWGEGNSYNNAGNGVITIEVQISDPGRYSFVWHSAVGTGSNGTEHNDSFLRIDADNYYGERNGSVVCPDDAPSSNRCSGSAPQGSSTDGFFKIYRSGSPDGFNWRAYTSDHDPHDIYAEFDSAGTYTLHIAGRSNSHAIDRLVLFRTGNGVRDISFDDATDLDLPESARA